MTATVPELEMRRPAPAPGGWWGAAWRQYRLERKMFWRNPSAAFFGVLLPLLLLAIFGAVFAGRREDLDVIVPGIAAMSIMSATFIALAYNVIVPQEIREAISVWATGVDETRAALNRVRIPTLISHGRDDALILPAAAEMTAAAIKGSRISWYDDCGHSPFVEHADRFNRELDEFAKVTRARHVGADRT